MLGSYLVHWLNSLQRPILRGSRRTNNMWGPLIGAGIGAATSYFNNRNNNRRAGQIDQQLAGIPAYGQQAYQPFINQGQQAQGQLSPLYQQMAQDPSAYLNQLMQGYQSSPGYQFQRDSALGAARNSAAQGGFSGTGYDQRQQATLANGLASQDMQQYMQNLFRTQDAGISGQQQMADKGYLASGNLADYLGNAQSMRARLGYAQNKQRAAGDDAMGNAFGGIFGAGMQGLGQVGANRDAQNMARIDAAGKAKMGDKYNQSQHGYNQDRDGSWLSTIFGGYK